MSRRTFTTADKIAIATGWAAAQAAGESQQSYAARVGVSARRVREFTTEFGVPIAPLAEARRTIQSAIDDLNRLLVRIEDRPDPAAAVPARPSGHEHPSAVAPPPSIDAPTAPAPTGVQHPPAPGRKLSLFDRLFLEQDDGVDT